MNKTLVIIVCHSKKIYINGMSDEPRKIFASCAFVTLLHVVKNQWRYHVGTAGGSNAKAEAHCLTRNPKFEDLEVLMLHF